jgi:hypothetical protein
MTYLVLFDDVGVAQRVASTAIASEVRQFLENGFIEVTKEEYDRHSKTAIKIGVTALAGLAAALVLLAALRRRRGTPTPVRNEEGLRRLKNAFIATANAEAARVRAGDITPDEWFNIMSRRLKRLHISAGAAGVGGVSGLNNQMLRRIEQVINEQLNWLRRFRDTMRSRLDSDNPMSEKEIAARTRMYAGASNQTFEGTYQDGLGIPRLPAQPGVRTICLTNCKCDWRINELAGRGNWNCFWILSAVENCPTCLARRRSFSPLRIRNGVIQSYSTAGIYN